MEILKREYPNSVWDPKGKGRDVSGARLPAKLYQYNSLVNHKPAAAPIDQQERAVDQDEPTVEAVKAHDAALTAIVRSGGKRPKIKHLPVMSVLLCTKKITGLDTKVWT